MTYHSNYAIDHIIITVNLCTQAAVDIFTDEPSLEKRMWKFCAMRVGLALLQNHFAFRVSGGRACLCCFRSYLGHSNFYGIELLLEAFFHVFRILLIPNRKSFACFNSSAFFSISEFYLPGWRLTKLWNKLNLYNIFWYFYFEKLFITWTISAES